MGIISDGVKKLFGQSRFFDSTIKIIANGAIYDEASLEFCIKSATGNGDVFTVINKITQPASNLPIRQVDKITLKDKPGKALALLNNPNPLQNRTEFLDGALTFHCIFGEGFIAKDSIDSGLNANQPLRLELLPPHCMIEQLGTVQEPIKGWTMRWSMSGKPDYGVGEVFHWKDFNPNYDETGNWLRGQSRLKPILKSIAGSDAGYDSLIATFQNMGAYGVLTILGVKQKEGDYSDKVTTKQQLSQFKNDIKNTYYGAKKRGQVVATNKSVEWTPFNIKPVDLEILSSLDKFSGKIYDAYDVPFILSSAGAGGNKYDTYPQAVLDLWLNAIQPRVNNFLDKFSGWLMPQFPGEDGTMFIADYSGVPCLQEAMRLKIKWMKESGLFSIDEMRVAANFEAWGLPNTNVPLVPLGLQRIDEIGIAPTPDQTANALKHYKDYRLQN
jgi:phage portal protein BeeE